MKFLKEFFGEKNDILAADDKNPVGKELIIFFDYNCLYIFITEILFCFIFFCESFQHYLRGDLLNFKLLILFRAGLLTFFLPVLSADNLCKTVWTQIRPDKTSGLILIKAFCHIHGIPDFFFYKKKIENKNQQMTKVMKISACKEKICSN